MIRGKFVLHFINIQLTHINYYGNHKKDPTKSFYLTIKRYLNNIDASTNENKLVSQQTLASNIFLKQFCKRHIL